MSGVKQEFSLTRATELQARPGFSRQNLSFAIGSLQLDNLKKKNRQSSKGVSCPRSQAGLFGAFPKSSIP